MSETHGIRKVSENILAPGRAIIVTEKDKDKYTWGEIPDGSLFVDSETGIMAVKLHGQSDWVPAGIKNDGTINIAKDNINKVESFTVVQEMVPDNPDEFIYTNSEGKQRHGVKEWNSAKTVVTGYIFTLEEGTYVMHKNHLQVTIDDVLHRSVATGGVEEISEKRFRLTEQLVDKMEITVEYSAAFRMGSPYPRFFMNGEAPEASEVGDFWLDTDSTLEEDGPMDDIEDNKRISWSRIENHPTTLIGYGISDKLAKEDHTHKIDDIVGMPTQLPANGGHADSADIAIKAGTTKRAETAAMANMAINDGANRNIVATYLTKDGEGATGTWPIDISGRADSARKADCDSYGRDIASTYFTSAGGTLKNALNFGNNVWNAVGDDAYFGDANQTGCIAIRGANNTTGIAFVRREDAKDIASIKYDGSTMSFDKPIKGNLLGNATSASRVNWGDVVDKPTAMPASGGHSDISTLADSIKNDEAVMKFHWKEKDGQPQWYWGGNDMSNANIYKASNLSVASARNADNATTLDGHSVGENAGQIPVVKSNGRISNTVLPDHKHDVSDLNQFTVSSIEPQNPKENALWFDTASMSIKVYKNGAWIMFGAAYQ